MLLYLANTQKTDVSINQFLGETDSELNLIRAGLSEWGKTAGGSGERTGKGNQWEENKAGRDNLNVRNRTNKSGEVRRANQELTQQSRQEAGFYTSLPPLPPVREDLGDSGLFLPGCAGQDQRRSLWVICSKLALADRTGTSLKETASLTWPSTSTPGTGFY
jgi:hypothetical protein